MYISPWTAGSCEELNHEWRTRLWGIGLELICFLENRYFFGENGKRAKTTVAFEDSSERLLGSQIFGCKIACNKAFFSFYPVFSQTPKCYCFLEIWKVSALVCQSPGLDHICWRRLDDGWTPKVKRHSLEVQNPKNALATDPMGTEFIFLLLLLLLFFGLAIGVTENPGRPRPWWKETRRKKMADLSLSHLSSSASGALEREQCKGGVEEKGWQLYCHNKKHQWHETDTSLNWFPSLKSFPEHKNRLFFHLCAKFRRLWFYKLYKYMKTYTHNVHAMYTFHWDT